MSTAILDPNADVSVQWQLVASTATFHYGAVTDAIRQPAWPGTLPSSLNLIQAELQNKTDTLGFENLAVASYTATQVKIWFFWEDINPTGMNMSVTINIGGASPGENFALTAINDETWQSATVNGSWTKAELDAMTVSLTSSGTNPVAGAIWALYALVTYTSPAIASSARSHGYIF